MTDTPVNSFCLERKTHYCFHILNCFYLKYAFTVKYIFAITLFFYGHLKKLVYGVSNKLKYVFDSTSTAIRWNIPIEKDNIDCFSDEAFSLNGFQRHERCFVIIHCIIKQEKIMKETQNDRRYCFFKELPVSVEAIGVISHTQCWLTRL